MDTGQAANWAKGGRPVSVPGPALYRVAGGFGGADAAGRGGPPEGAVGELIRFPSRILFEPVVAAAFRTAITQARSPARLVRDIMLEIAGGSRSAADRAGAGGVPDLGQVPQLDAGVVTLGLEPVVAVLGGNGVEGDHEVWSFSSDPQPPDPIPARRAVLI